MAHHRSTSSMQALYRVVVLPSLSQSAHRQFIRTSSKQPFPKTSQIRSFRSTPTRLAKTREPEPRTEKWDEEITAKIVYLIDPSTNKILPAPRTRYDILRRLNRTTHRLIQFSQELDGIPVCKIVNKKEVYQREQKQKQEAKEKKKLESASKSLKTLELNWAMDHNDLGHRLDKVTEFLSEGRRVEVILASKKRGRKASTEECEVVLQKIRKTVDGVEGAKEAKSMEGKVGGFATLFFQGRVQQQQLVGEEKGG